MDIKQKKQTTFLIVGAGPSGLILGIRLLELNFSVLIVERHDHQIRPVCGEYLSPQGVDYLKAMKLGQHLRGFGPIHGMTIYSSHNSKVSTIFPENKKGLAINRATFQKRLAQEFCSKGGSISYESCLEKIHSRESGFEVQTSKETIVTEYLIGADGRQSKVAKLLGFKTGEPLHKKVALHCYLKPKFPLPSYGQMHVLPDGSYIGINPISSEEVNFSIVTTQMAIKDMGIKPLINFWINERASLKEQFSLLQGEEIKTTSPLTRKSLEIVKERAALIGDASGFIDPLTGEGITTAIKTAYILSEEVARNSQIEKAFEAYALRRKNDFLEKEKLNHLFQKIIKSPFACEVIAKTLNLSSHLQNTFIGVIGNIYTPRQALKVLCNLYIKERY